VRSIREPRKQVEVRGVAMTMCNRTPEQHERHECPAGDGWVPCWEDCVITRRHVWHEECFPWCEN